MKLKILLRTVLVFLFVNCLLRLLPIFSVGFLVYFSPTFKDSLNIRVLGLTHDVCCKYFLPLGHLFLDFAYDIFAMQFYFYFYTVRFISLLLHLGHRTLSVYSGYRGIHLCFLLKFV